MHKQGHAVVIGASIGGLLAARVLSKYFAQVTLLERDPIPQQAQPRRGVPQGAHGHGLLALGYGVLQQLFPGFAADLELAGGRIVDAVKDGAFFQNGGYLSGASSEMRASAISRPMLEACVRERVLGLPGVVAQTEVTVVGPICEKGRVTGVGLKSGIRNEVVRADLVVDASGRGSRSPVWLEAMGFAKPPISEVKINLLYVSRLYEHNPSDFGGRSFVIVAPYAPHHKRGGIALTQEGGRWMVTLMGMHGDHPPTDESGYLEFARSLPSPDIFHLISRAKPLSEPVAFKIPSNLRHHYERLERFPENYLVLGDALCCFNPMFAQGMTVAALQAQALEQTLAAGSHNLRQRFFKHAAKAVDTPWMLVVGADLGYPETIGKRGPETKLINGYISRLVKAAHQDPALSLAFYKVSNMVKPPSSLFALNVMWRVLRSNLGRTKPVVSTIWGGENIEKMLEPLLPPPKAEDMKRKTP